MRLLCWIIPRVTLLVVMQALTGCVTQPPSPEDALNAAGTYSERYATDSQTACLSVQQVFVARGYDIAQSTETSVHAKKRTLSATAEYTDVELHVVCVPESADRETLVFMNGTQARYAFQKNRDTPHRSRFSQWLSHQPDTTEETLTELDGQIIHDKPFYTQLFAALRLAIAANRPKHITSVTDRDTVRHSRAIGK